MRIEIVVDELILRGVPPERARSVAASVEARLGELAEQADATLPGRAEAFRKLPAIEATADSLGDSVADAVWGAVSGGGR